MMTPQNPIRSDPFVINARAVLLGWPMLAIGASVDIGVLCRQFWWSILVGSAILLIPCMGVFLLRCGIPPSKSQVAIYLPSALE